MYRRCCDRCGAEILAPNKRRREQQRVWIILLPDEKPFMWTSVSRTAVKDLCERCQDELLAWHKRGGK